MPTSATSPATTTPVETASPRRFQPVRLDAAHDLRQQAGRHLRAVLGGRALRLTIVAADDSLYLAGRVDTWTQKQAAQEAVRGVAAGRTLVNDLMVA